MAEMMWREERWDDMKKDEMRWEATSFKLLDSLGPQGWKEPGKVKKTVWQGRKKSFPRLKKRPAGLKKRFPGLKKSFEVEKKLSGVEKKLFPFSCVAHMELIRILGGSTSNQRIIGKIIFPRLKNPIIKLGTTKEVPSTLSPFKFSGCFSDVTHNFFWNFCTGPKFA